MAGLEPAGIAHLATLAMIPDCETVAVIDPDSRRARDAAGLGFKAPRFADVETLLAKLVPDALIASGPPDRHLAFAGPALAAGVSVLVDPPLAHTLESAEQLAALAQSHGARLACGHALAYEPVFHAAREALAGGALGALMRARCSIYRSDVFGPRQGWRFEPARSGGGVVANLAADLLFLLDWYLEAPIEVRATWKKLYGEVEDELHAMMRLRSGAEVGFDCSWSVPGYPRAAVVVELEGENGKLLASDDALELDLTSERGGQARGHTVRRRAELPPRARFDWDGEALYLQDASFLAWVTGGPPPPTELRAALRVQRVIDALYRSADQGGAPVEIAS